MAYHVDSSEKGSPARVGQPSSPLVDTGLALAWRNRRVLSVRLGWPDGAVEVCEQVERDHPDWYPNYSQGGSRARPEVGYYALPWKPPRPGQAPVFGADADALIAAIRANDRAVRRGGAR